MLTISINFIWSHLLDIFVLLVYYASHDDHNMIRISMDTTDNNTVTNNITVDTHMEDNGLEEDSSHFCNNKESSSVNDSSNSVVVEVDSLDDDDDDIDDDDDVDDDDDDDHDLDTNMHMDMDSSQDTSKTGKDLSDLVECSQDTTSTSMFTSPKPMNNNNTDIAYQHSITILPTEETSEKQPRKRRTLEELPTYLWNNKDLKGKEKQKKQHEWISKLNHTHVELTDDKKEIAFIDDLPFSYVTLKMLKILCKPYSFPSSIDGKRDKNTLVTALVNAIKSDKMKDLMKKNLKEKLNESSKNKTNTKSTTKPNVISKEGTLFRVINVITSVPGREFFQRTRKAYDRVDLDSNKIPHFDHYDNLLRLYLDVRHTEFDSLHASVMDIDNSFLNHVMNLSTYNPKDYDVLTPEDMKNIVEYIVSNYHNTRVKKNRSGQNKKFHNFIQGKIWLLYLHRILKSLGNRDLLNCCFVELNSEAMVTSSDMDNIGKYSNDRKKRKGSDSQEEEHKEKKLMTEMAEAKMNSISAFMKKTKTTEKIFLNRRLSEVYDLLSSYKSDLNNLRSSLRNIKTESFKSSSNLEELKVQYDNSKEQYKLKKRMISSLEREFEDLQATISTLRGNDTVNDSKENDDDSSMSSF